MLLAKVVRYSPVNCGHRLELRTSPLPQLTDDHQSAVHRVQGLRQHHRGTDVQGQDLGLSPVAAKPLRTDYAGLREAYDAGVIPLIVEADVDLLPHG